MSNALLLLGAGGHCESIVDTLLRIDDERELGIVAPGGDGVLGVPVVGTDDDLCSLREKGYGEAFVAVGSVGDSSLRVRLFSRLIDLGFEVPSIVDPSALVSPSSALGRGVFVGKGCVIGPCSTVGDNAIVNTRAVVEHDCWVGRNTHVAPGAVLCGDVTVGEGCHIGAGATVIQGVSIGNDTLVGAGGVVVRSVGADEIVFGCPARSRGGR
uniref:acetyltransferase n=1 Tax=Olsenella timonensis TaxID=1805478 RepID=UPI00094E84C3|nr:acetyltransferase [Olsenella timonensis]